jgi:GNAT superfamily N-acetyltransferase
LNVRKGLGSKALSKFRESAINLGCNGALARVGFDSWERRSKNISFYEKNGWVLLTKEEDMPYPLDLVFLDLR